jgi:hypothetical protein
MDKEQYQLEYEQCIASYKSGQTSAEEIGEVIARMAQYFAQKNMIAASIENVLNKKSVEIVQGQDDSGKPLSVAKADILIKATEEAQEFRQAKVHLENIEQYINALKYFQKGILNEYSHMQA